MNKFITLYERIVNTVHRKQKAESRKQKAEKQRMNIEYSKCIYSNLVLYTGTCTCIDPPVLRVDPVKSSAAAAAPGSAQI